MRCAAINDILRQDHLRERKLECQRGFRSLIVIDPILMNRVMAASSQRIVERLAQVIASESRKGTSEPRPSSSNSWACQ